MVVAQLEDDEDDDWDGKEDEDDDWGELEDLMQPRDDDDDECDDE